MKTEYDGGTLAIWFKYYTDPWLIKFPTQKLKDYDSLQKIGREWEDRVAKADKGWQALPEKHPPKAVRAVRATIEFIKPTGEKKILAEAFSYYSRDEIKAKVQFTRQYGRELALERACDLLLKLEDRYPQDLKKELRKTEHYTPESKKLYGMVKQAYFGRPRGQKKEKKEDVPRKQQETGGGGVSIPHAPTTQGERSVSAKA